MSNMSLSEASAKEKTAYRADNNSGVIYVIGNSKMTTESGAFVAMRRNDKWEFAPYLTNGLLADYSLILDYDVVEALVTEARTSLSV